MPSYPFIVSLCQHIKVDGVQCGSPALRHEKYCHYHIQWRQKSRQITLSARREPSHISMPPLEDADSIRAIVVELTRLLATNQIDRPTARLLLSALQIASSNLKRTSFEPSMPIGAQEFLEQRIV